MRVLMENWSEAPLGEWTQNDGEGQYTQQVQELFRQGKGRVAEFRVTSPAKAYYCCYMPVDLADWIVVLAAPEVTILAAANEILENFYLVGFVLLTVMLLYLGWILHDTKRELTKNEEQIKNVQYLLDVEQELFESYAQPERISRALESVSWYTTADNAFFWLFEEGVADRRLWSNRDLRVLAANSDPMLLFPKTFRALLETGRIISYDLKPLYGKYADEKRTIETGEVYNLMAVVVNDMYGRRLGILGAYNMTKKWEDTKPLDQVALSFALSITHYNAYRELARMGHMDELTGLLNRNSYHVALLDFVREKCQTLGCIYVDVNGLHELNNHLGHKAGDQMLCSAASALRESFPDCGIYRVGGDEFVVLCQDKEEDEIKQRIAHILDTLGQQDYYISVGLAWQEGELDITAAVDAAEAAMQQDKRRYYENGGGERQMRNLEKKMNQILKEKQDMDVLLRTLNLGVQGAYFVDLHKDTCRSVESPKEFDAILERCEGVFSKTLLEYMKQRVDPDYHTLFEWACDYHFLNRHLDNKGSFEFAFLCSDDRWIKLRITPTEQYNSTERETMWVFSQVQKQV